MPEGDREMPISPIGLAPRCGREEYWREMVLWAGMSYQILAALIWAGLWLRLGASTYALVIGMVVAGLAAAGANWILARVQLFDSAGEWTLAAWLLFGIGFLCFLFAGTLLISAISYVAHETLVVFVLIPMLIFGVWHSLRHQVLDTSSELVAASIHNEGALAFRWLMVCCAIVIGPVLVGWSVASWSLSVFHDERLTVRGWLDGNSRKPADCAQLEAGGRKLVVALALSGGGYRAALTHAGVLQALDEGCIKVQLLSTVSGGSIVGAAYALGVPPHEFARRLMAQKPGLPNELAHISAVTSLSAGTSLIAGRKTSTDIYRDHFRKVFYGDRGLSELKGGPRHIINVTNAHPSGNDARDIIVQGYAPSIVERKLLVADAVAASGAFPGIFTMKPLPWFEHRPDAIVLGDHFLIDGGIVENLGTEGLRRYVREHGWSHWERTRPDILIISDAGAYSRPAARILLNPSAVELLSRASGIQFDMLHRLLYAELTGSRDVLTPAFDRPEWQQFYRAKYPVSFMPQGRQPSQEHALRTVIIPTTASISKKAIARHPECVGPQGRSSELIHDQVAQLSTLHELSSDDAKAAYWLGYALGAIYGQAIECARRDITGEPCGEAPRSRPLSCSLPAT